MVVLGDGGGDVVGFGVGAGEVEVGGWRCGRGFKLGGEEVFGGIVFGVGDGGEEDAEAAGVVEEEVACELFVGIGGGGEALGDGGFGGEGLGEVGGGGG